MKAITKAMSCAMLMAGLSLGISMHYNTEAETLHNAAILADLNDNTGVTAVSFNRMSIDKAAESDTYGNYFIVFSIVSVMFMIPCIKDKK